MYFESVILDADFCNKIGGIEKFTYLKKLLPLIAKKVYMHKIVYDEIMLCEYTKSQIDELIETGIIHLIDEISLNNVENTIYKQTFNLLKQRMMNPNNPRKNRGEVASLAYAKTCSIPIFATDEKDLQTIINEVLNTGINDIQCLRIIDLITLIKDNKILGFERKDAKLIWRLSGKLTTYFDTEIWPI